MNRLLHSFFKPQFLLFSALFIISLSTVSIGDTLDSEVDQILDETLGTNPTDLRNYIGGISGSQLFDTEINITTSLGTDSNILGSGSNILASPFLKIAGDYYLGIPISDKLDLDVFIYVEDKHLLAIRTECDDQYLSFHSQLNRSLSDQIEIGLATDLIWQSYLDTTSSLEPVGAIASSSLGLSPRIGIQFGSSFIDISLYQKQISTAATGETYDNTGMRAKLVIPVSNESRLSITATSDTKKYRLWEALDSTGISLATPLQTSSFRINASFETEIGKNSTIGTFADNLKIDDNGGYYIAEVNKLYINIAHHFPVWNFFSEISFDSSNYPDRVLSTDSSQKLSISSLIVSAKFDRELFTDWTIGLGNRYAQSISNDTNETYTKNEIFGEIGTTF